MEKETGELLNELTNSTNLENYFSENESDFLNYTLAEYFDELFKEIGAKKTDVVKKSNLSPGYAYHILAGLKKPSRDRIIALAIGFDLNLTQTQRLLRVAKFSELYARDKRDCVVIYAIQKKLSVIALNSALFEKEMEILEGTTRN